MAGQLHIAKHNYAKCGRCMYADVENQEAQYQIAKFFKLEKEKD